MLNTGNAGKRAQHMVVCSLGCWYPIPKTQVSEQVRKNSEALLTAVLLALGITLSTEKHLLNSTDADAPEACSVFAKDIVMRKLSMASMQDCSSPVGCTHWQHFIAHSQIFKQPFADACMCW